MQVPVSLGERIPVRYDAANPARAVIDRPALEKQALEYFIEQQERQKGQHKARAGAAAGPPWSVPARCPNCGAPVDQATASRAADPHCEFCGQPVPVSPLASSGSS
jgi:hypothetical protein